MSKGASKTGGSRRRAQRGQARRSRTSRPVKTTVLIVGEGRETEPNYFRALRSEESVDRRFAITVKKGRGISREDVVNQAVKLKAQADSHGKGFDEVWCVLDVETPGARESLNRALAKAKEHGITACLSNPCFEVWLLSHFEKKARAYNDCDAVIARLNKHWAKVCAEDYRKNDENVYGRVSDLTQTAIENAQWVRDTHHGSIEETADANSSTEVYRLVRRLLD